MEGECQDNNRKSARTVGSVLREYQKNRHLSTSTPTRKTDVITIDENPSDWSGPNSSATESDTALTSPPQKGRKRPRIPPALPGSRRVRARQSAVMNSAGKPKAPTKLSKENKELFDMLKEHMDYQFGGLGNQISSLQEEVTQNTERFEGLSNEVHQNKSDIEKMGAQLLELKEAPAKNLENQIENMVGRIMDEKERLRTDSVSETVKKISQEVEEMKTTAPGRAVSDQPEDEKNYWFARRSIRCWPVLGETKKDTWTSLGEFLQDKLRVPASKLAESDVEEIRRLHPTSSEATIKNEVLVVFKDVQVRDMVFKHAHNLQQWRDGAPANSIGIRMHVPTHLMGKQKAFNSHGFALKTKYGSGLKRHTRFDDLEQDIVMDVKLPGDSEWYTVDHQFALEEIRQNRRTGNRRNARGRLSSCVEPSGMEVDPLPTAPLSAPPLSSGQAGPRTQRHRLTTLRKEDTENEIFTWGKDK